MKLRRSAAVGHKPLKLLARRFVAADLRRFAVVPKRPMQTTCGGPAVVAVRHPPYPLCASRRHWRAPRAQERGKRVDYGRKLRPVGSRLAEREVPDDGRTDLRDTDRSAADLAGETSKPDRLPEWGLVP